MYIDYTGDSTAQQIGNSIASAGIIYKSLTNAVEINALRKAAPMIQSTLLMTIIVLLPLVITLGGYEPKVIITLTFVMFTVIFLTFVWEFARFLDTKLIEIMYENKIVSFLNNQFSTDNKSIVDLITSMVFVGFPILLLASMSWTGYRIGQGVSGMLDKSTTKMQDAGSDGTKLATKTAPNVASKAVGKIK